MNVESKKGRQDPERFKDLRFKSERDKHLNENYKILKQTYFKSVRRYDIIHSCIKYEGI